MKIDRKNFIKKSSFAFLGAMFSPFFFKNDSQAAPFINEQQLHDNTNKLIEALKRFPAEKLSQIVGSEGNAVSATGYTYEFMISGLLQHNAYDGGQISLLKK
ncbi:MAG: hypothetical protein M1495_18220 [Bacteroidetes bacterium]|nr:hypothetical protein [Bacteroidota bacterium]